MWFVKGIEQMNLYRRYLLIPITVIGGLFLLAAVSYGQFWTPTKGNQKRSALVIDHTHFRSETPDQIRLEVYYQVYHFGLKFKKEKDQFIANYRLITSVMGKKDRIVAVDSIKRKIVVASERRTRSPFDYRSSQFSFDLPPGKYKVRVDLHDLSNKKVISLDFKTKLKKINDKAPQFSGVEFTQAVHASKEKPGPFAKGKYDVIPSVSRAFGGSDSAKLLYYLEIYQAKETEKYSSVLVETRLRHRTKGMLYRDTLWVHLEEPVIRQVRNLSLGDLPAGDYELEIYLRGRRNKELDKLTEEFRVLWSPEGMIRNDWKTAMRQLAYIGDPGEMKKIKDLKERKKAFDAFWQERDPTPQTELNETKREFYRRVDFANRTFTALKRDGWRTDRGMIYIQHGKPDELDDIPYAANSVPFQVWHFYRQGEYLRFTFIDENQDGDYRLQFPYDGRGQRPDF